ncbi:ethylene-responsive transcription factor ERF091-like, partial [Quillaja saponaria]
FFTLSHIISNMAIHGRHHADSGGILEDVWANFIGGDRAEHGGIRNSIAESSNTWEELPSLDGRNGSIEILERLPSLGRWISMGAEAWEELLDGIVPARNIETKHSAIGNLETTTCAADCDKKVNVAKAVEKVVEKHYRGVRRRPVG